MSMLAILPKLLLNIYDSRFVLAATDHLRHKSRRMEARMRSLEDALAIAHSSETDRPHPLLGVRMEAEGDDSPKLKPVAEESSTTPLSASQSLGTLWLDGQGGSRFFGPSGGSEVCVSLCFLIRLLILNIFSRVFSSFVKHFSLNL